MSQNVESVESMIQQRNEIKKNHRKKKVIKILLLVIIHLSAAFSLYFYVTNSFSEINAFELSGNQYLSRTDIESLIPQKKMFGFLNYGFTLTQALENEPMIKSINLDFSKINTLELVIEEFKPIAQMEEPHIYLLENGQTVRIETHQLFDLPIIIGYSNSELVTVASALNSLKPQTLIMISSILKKPLSYDPLYAHIRMQDGIQVETGFSRITVLDDYLEIKQALNPAHQCIAIDETQGVPYSFPCD